jgi:hypothetical protein
MLEEIKNIATIATPLLLLVIGGVGWVAKNKIEQSQVKQNSQLKRIQELEDRLRAERIAIYDELLEPFFLLFTAQAAVANDKRFRDKNKNDVAIAKMLTYEYRMVGFKLSLLATDEVVRAYGQLMQFFYHQSEDPTEIAANNHIWVGLLATLLLDIRKSMGNESSKLDKWEMIEWFMKDFAVLRGQSKDFVAQQ